jgi:ferredoxin-type protein NapG
MSDSATPRRQFLLNAARSVALAATGGLLWSYLLQQQARATPYALRPPGAVGEEAFNAMCIKCGQCITACPYDTLKLAAAGDTIPLGTPYFLPRQVPCYMCPDIPCKRACPTGALDPDLTGIERSRMGLAVIDVEHCLSWQGLRCEICYRTCPLIDRAITVEYQPRRLSKHALFVPTVHSEACTGCGLCEQACPTQEAAIRVLPHPLIQGKIGEHYRLGWKSETGITQEFHPYERPAAAPLQPQSAPGLDYLNEEGL